WVGTLDGGVDRFDPRPPSFRTYRHEPVYSVLQGKRGILWLGGTDGPDGISPKTGEVTQSIPKHVLSQSAFGAVPAIAEDHEGYVWFGSSGNGLARFDPRTGSSKSFRHNPENPMSLSNDSVSSLLVDHAGTLWIGAYDALNRFEPETGQFQRF